MPAGALPLRHPPSCWPNCWGSLLGLHPSFDRQQRLWERGMMRFVGRRQSSGLDFRDLRCPFGTYALDVEFASLEERGRQEEDMLGIEGATTVDVGANLGFRSIYLAARMQRSVLAIEANPLIYRLLLWNIRANNVTDRVWPINAALSGDGSGRCDPSSGLLVDCVTLRVDVDIAKSHRSGFAGGSCGKGVACFRVPAWSLGNLLEALGIQEVDHLKLNCEGCEYHVLSDPAVQHMTSSGRLRISGEIHHPDRFPGISSEMATATMDVMCKVLLKLESAYFEEAEKWDALLEIYISTLNRALAEGDVTQNHFADGWPLRQGAAHALALRALGRREAAPGRPLDIIVCYCSERLSWLRAFHKLPWRDENRSAAIRELVTLRIYHKCGGYGTGVREAESERLRTEWGPYFREVDVRYVDDVLRADDDSAYLAFIIDWYEDLPEYTVFLHADAPEHIPSLELLTDSVYAAIRGFLPSGIGFVHFAHNYVLLDWGCDQRKDCEGRQLEPEFSTLWKRVFGASVAPSLAAGHVNAYCCVQFMVHRSRIRLRPKSFYEHGLAYFGTTAESYHRLFPVGRVVRKADVFGRTPGQLAMYIWHAMFGEALKLPRRQQAERVEISGVQVGELCSLSFRGLVVLHVELLTITKQQR
ncbi:unnamed protein product [Symbiodinium sp. CCMP2456]|nr:unnamed protein product [Symbiodinium sp. CCMP2456]